MKEARLDNVPDLFELPDKSKMNNPGIDLAIWERLRKRWTRFEAAGYKLKIDFHLLADVDNEENILAIDVIQNINDEFLSKLCNEVRERHIQCWASTDYQGNVLLKSARK